ncbi:hypothetical protein Rhe02_06410 [Rhizocola hellebori]|uniref:Uncharacterized protein n=1 Tax=Rhizocola hellebori TaxID=1392758 RepID=A0A8J3VCI0_9ACTN|nr:hypothetical protein [Rhizocola hellebori]GIH02574.1 hypothetical protein Rhe02_06410 [Rhizocola hellebori]
MDIDAIRDKRDGQLVDFESAEVISPMIYPPQPTLVVSGEKPHPEMEISLEPLVYVSQPQYQGIQVVGKPALPDGPHVSPAIAPVPYSVELRIDELLGSQGVEVIGATCSERKDVSTGEATES